MNAGNAIAIAVGVVALVAAYFARREAAAATASANSAAEQVRLTQLQVDVMQSAEAREIADQEARAFHARSATVTVDRETGAMYGGREAIVVRSQGPATARSVGLEVTATGHGDVFILDHDGAQPVSTVQRAELQPDETWILPLVFPDGMDGIPYELRLVWDDDNQHHNETARVEMSGPRRVD